MHKHANYFLSFPERTRYTPQDEATREFTSTAAGHAVCLQPVRNFLSITNICEPLDGLDTVELRLTG
jgi:hypothetical protein